ncbi:MAG: hypothetical protein IJ306_03000 [Oscillospiraceae bacterium]|nr:hypothetical protein [Oscillospiraceae bacterium]
MKRYKVKHYRSRIYNPIRGKIIKGVLIAVIAAAIFGIGWFAYEPLMEAINERNKEIIEEDPVPPKPQEPAYEPLPEEFLEKETVAVTVPEDKLYSSLDYYEFLNSLDEEVTAVVIDMKTQSGTVTYSSSQVSVINAGAIHENAVNLENRIKVARNLGFDIVVRVYAFEDSTAPYNAGDMAIRYESEEGVLWLDDSVDNGGKPWLNPYSDTAQKYILDIIYDAIDCGADAILLDGVRFPEEEGMDYAYFGVSAEGISRGEILEQFTQRIYSSTVLTDTDLIIGYDSYAVITGSDIYGGSPLEFTADGYAPSIDLNDFVGERINEDFYFKELPEDLTELITKIYDSLGNIAGLDLLPVASCEGFTKAEMKTIWSYFESKNTAGYIIVYDEPYFTGIPAEPEIPPEEETPVTPVVPQQPTQPTQPSQPTQPEPEPEPEPEQGTGSASDEEGDSNPGVTIKDYTQ